MRKFLTTIFTALAVAFSAAPVFAVDAANDVVLSQRKADNSGFIQRNLAPTASGFWLFDSSKVPSSPSNMTYNSGTGLLSFGNSNAGVAFGTTTPGIISGTLGAITLTGAGTNQNITLTPSDAAAQGAVSSAAIPASASIVGTGGFQVYKQAVSGSIFPSIELVGYQNGQTAQVFNVLAKAGGTQAAPTTATANATIGGYRFYARANGAWQSVGNWSTQTSPTFGDADFSTRMVLGPSTSTAVFNAIDINGGAASDGAGKGLAFGAMSSATTAATTMFHFDSNGNYSRASSWGTTGAFSAWAGRTITDKASSGTVATAVANSFAVPTFAASSATTFTNAANLYIAGDVAAGTNVTLTNSYGLWNVGKTRLDGALITTPQALSGAGAVNTTTTATNYTSTGAAQALTLANGTAGQIKYIVHQVDGGSGVLTPTSAIGFTTITFTNVGDSVTLIYTSSGWSIVGIFGAVAA